MQSRMSPHACNFHSNKLLSSTVRRFNISTMSPEIEFPLEGGDQFFGSRSAGQIKVLPGNPHAIAVSLRYADVSPAFAGVAIFDDGV